MLSESETPLALVVEDDQATQGLISTVLSEEGFRVDEADNGEQALEFLNRQPYDVIVLDLQIPYVSGFQIIARMRDDFPGSLPAVVITSGLDVQILGHLATLCTVLPKPLDVSKLRRFAKERVAEKLR